jgi:transcriptional regulator with XRE-family HTH domain
MGDRLAKALRHANVSRQEMADILEVNPNTITNYTTDHTRPKDSYLRRWALRCNVSVQWLETGYSDEAPTPGGSDQHVDEFKQTRLAA